jgi:predicted nucleic acid-binding protein
MILVDSSVWVEHFRSSQSHLVELLTGGMVAVHPFVLGELSCGIFGTAAKYSDT